ncbi:zinc ABC transporter substrate-binding protein [Nicoliella sp. Es01]|uniref:Zinc ABC transporter substrate-binding protein n=2 Tax=Nicoliella lavandulae TaxID=3082954 RepID=A0ABU8SJG1_9LACO
MVFVLVGCSSKNDSSSKGIHVVSSVNFYGDAARAVLGNHGTVTSIITKSTTDPHDYQPSAQTAKDVAKADFAIYNGLGYDSWMKKLLTNASDDMKSVNVGSLMGKKTGDNPHIWYSSKTMPKLVNELAKQFGEKDPKHRAEFKKNAAKYIKSLEANNKLIDQIKKNNTKNKMVGVSEPVFDYSLQEMGYKVADNGYAKSVENGTDPSPSDIKEIQDDIKNKKIAFFVDNSQASDKVVENLVKMANQHKIPVLKVTETMPNGMDYQEWMASQYKQLLAFQKGE